VYSKDCATALVIMMKMYDRLDQVTDLGANQFTQMRDLATIVATVSPLPCTVEFASRPAALAISDTPSNTTAFATEGGWVPRYNLTEAISELYTHFASQMTMNEGGCDLDLLDLTETKTK
jgi:nucleoside-diphosphate-sugar epimerase